MFKIKFIDKEHREFFKEKYNSLISDLENVLAVVNNNRNELNASNSDDDETDSEQKDSQPALESAGDKADRFDVDVPMSNQ